MFTKAWRVHSCSTAHALSQPASQPRIHAHTQPPTHPFTQPSNRQNHGTLRPDAEGRVGHDCQRYPPHHEGRPARSCRHLGQPVPVLPQPRPGQPPRHPLLQVGACIAMVDSTVTAEFTFVVGCTLLELALSLLAPLKSYPASHPNNLLRRAALSAPSLRAAHSSSLA